MFETNKRGNSQEFAVRFTGLRIGPRSGAFVGYPESRVPRHLVLWSTTPSVPFAQARGIFGRPVSDYLPGTDDLDTRCLPS